jgi:hypothetical protein
MAMPSSSRTANSCHPLGDERLQHTQHDEQADVDQEQPLAAEPVGEETADRRPEEDADQRRRPDQAGPHRRDAELLRQRHQRHAEHPEVEPVKALAPRRRQGEPPQEPPVTELGRARRGLRHVAPTPPRPYWFPAR